MYNRTHILPALRGLIGLRPALGNDSPELAVDADLTTSQSGQYVGDLHPFFELENFANALRRTDAYQSEYDAGQEYPAGATVAQDGTYYRTVATAAGQDLEDTDYWEPTTALSIWYRQLYESCVVEIVDALTAKKLSAGLSRQLQGNTPLYLGQAIRQNEIAKSGRFVGYRLSVPHDNLAAVLQRVGLQLSAAATVPLYLFHTSKTTPITTFQVGPTGAGQFHYQDAKGTEPGAVFQTLSGTEGYWLIGYYEEDLGAASALQIVNGVFYTSGCGGCNSSDATQRGNWNRYIRAVPVSATYTTKGVGDFNETTDYQDTNFGLNLTFSFRCDLSDLIVREKESLRPALAACLRYRLLDFLSASGRNNQQADQVGVLAYNQAHDFDDPLNPRKLYSTAVGNLDLETSGLDPVCFPSGKRAGVTRRIIGC